MTTHEITLAVRLAEQAQILEEADLSSVSHLSTEHAHFLFGRAKGFCGAYIDEGNGRTYACERAPQGWFPGLHRTADGCWFFHVPIIGGVWTSRKPA